ncbi:hypothetical protein ACA910_013550 [Epithemia clementina (nom. ined.)]
MAIVMARSSESKSPSAVGTATTAAGAGSASAASTETTVFVRWIPSSCNIRRHHLEELFSQIGPIRKSSVIVPRTTATTTAASRHPPAAESLTKSDSAVAQGEESKQAAASSYGFIKYTTADDAIAAAAKLDHAKLQLSPTEVLQLRVERASVATAKTKKRTHTGAVVKSHQQHKSNLNDDARDKAVDDPKGTKEASMKDASTLSAPATMKRRTSQTSSSLSPNNNNNSNSTKTTNRLIVRNLSFYANESHVRKVMESQFGKVLEVHIPQVPNTAQGEEVEEPDKQSKQKPKKKTTIAPTHRGFAFVTFERNEDAQACLQQASDGKNPIVIQKRPVTVAHALNKTMYETNQQQQDSKSLPKEKNKNPLTKKGREKFEAQKRKEEGDHQKDDDQESNDQEDDDQESKDQEDEDDDVDDGSSAGSSSFNHSHDDKEEEDDEDEDDGTKTTQDNNRDDNAVAERRALFVRNLPFDATRHDLFELFRRFGHITGIFLVKDRETNMPKGTAFVSFRDAESATKAVQKATLSDSKFVSQREATETAGVTTTPLATADGLTIQGRPIFVNIALDKDTASTLVMEKSFDRTSSGKDRRNLYLKGEGRVDNNDAESENKKGKFSSSSATAWDDLPEQDKTKRQRAWSEKNTKLRSPIFFINPTRLSIRNLDKQVDESELKQLCVEATQRGLEQGLVSTEDMIAHWRASGELTMREIMKRVERGNEVPIVAPFDKKNVRKQIPSVFIDRDFSGGASKSITTPEGNKVTRPSRGFGFVEFQHHAHALACLRELNNNARYSKDYAAGGRHALTLQQKQSHKKRPKISAVAETTGAPSNDFLGSDGMVKVPRLIVEFTVENKAKARIQAEHREHQQANKVKQKIENREKESKNQSKKEKKKSRGARQRERKRKGKEMQEQQEDEDEAMRHSNQQVVNKLGGVKNKSNPTVNNTGNDEYSKKQETAKAIKPPPKKKKKLDAEDSHFEKLVASYEKDIVQASPAMDEEAAPSSSSSKKKKRWFEE